MLPVASGEHSHTATIHVRLKTASCIALSCSDSALAKVVNPVLCADQTLLFADGAMIMGLM